MPFPIDQVDFVRSVYVSDSLGTLSAIEFPLMRGLSLPEQELVEREIKERTEFKVKTLIKPIAQKVAEQTKARPEEIAAELYQYMRSQSTSNEKFYDINEIEGVAALHGIEELDEFKKIVSKTRDINQSIRVFIMMRRTDPNKALNWNPTAWKVEDALDPTEIGAEHSIQISLLCQLEEAGKAHYCIETRMNKEGQAVDVFYYTNDAYEKAQKKYESSTDKPKEENVEEIAKN
jgi:hypothetical protein